MSSCAIEPLSNTTCGYLQSDFGLPWSIMKFENDLMLVPITTFLWVPSGEGLAYLLCTRLPFVYIITMSCRKSEVMNSPQRFCLVITLCLLLFGLAVHTVPSSCSCNETRLDTSFPSGAESCLVCQLQSGLIDTSSKAPFSDRAVFTIDNQAESSPLEYADQISHPPILF